MTAIAGFTMPETSFPRYKARRIEWDQAANQDAVFAKRSAEHLDYSVDLTHRLAPSELVTGASGESSDDDALPVTWVRFASYGVVAFVEGGIDGAEYLLKIRAETNRARVLTYTARITTYGEAAEAADAYKQPVLGSVSDPAQNYLTDVKGGFMSPTWVDGSGNLLTPNYGTP